MKKFNDERSVLKQRLIEMGQLGQQMIQSAVQALVHRDQNAIRQVRSSEKVMDRMQMEIDDEAIRLITVYTPVAGDLRFLLMTSRICSELERVGDQARNMCKYVKLLISEPEFEPPAELPQMANHVCQMLHAAVDAYDRADAAKAMETMNLDPQVDDMDRKVFKDLVTGLGETPDLTSTVALVLLSRSLERIGDHVTNICEEVVYLVEAKDIRHKR